MGRGELRETQRVRASRGRLGLLIIHAVPFRISGLRFVMGEKGYLDGSRDAPERLGRLPKKGAGATPPNWKGAPGSAFATRRGSLARLPGHYFSLDSHTPPPETAGTYLFPSHSEVGHEPNNGNCDGLPCRAGSAAGRPRAGRGEDQTLPARRGLGGRLPDGRRRGLPGGRGCGRA